MEATPIAVRHSVLDERAVLAMVLEAFDLPEPVTCHLAQVGLVDEYRVRGARRHGLSVWPAGSPEPGISWELDLAERLEGQGVVGAVPQRRRDGRMLSRLEAPEGIRLAVLWGLPSGRRLGTEPAEWHRLGAAVAAFHGATDRFSSPYARLPLDLDHLLGPIERWIEPMLRNRRSESAMLQATLRRLGSVVEIAAERADWGPCHGAATGADAIVVEDGRVAFLDLSQAAPGWRIWDLATAADTARHRRDSEAADAVLAGYLDDRYLPDVDLSLLDAVGALRCLWHVGQLASGSPRIGAVPAERAWAELGLPLIRSWA